MIDQVPNAFVGARRSTQPLGRMNSVFVLQHSHSPTPDDEEVKLIGVYSSRAAAEDAVARLRDSPGFRNHPQIIDEGSEAEEGFHIVEYELDQDHWVEGFVSWADAFEGK